MAIRVDQSFERTSPNPIDESLVLTKAEMLLIDDNKMPSNYFAVCKDDGQFYVYNKLNAPSDTTGKFKLIEGISQEDVQTLIDEELAGITGFELEIVEELPLEGSKGKIYLLPASDSEHSYYEEYIWVEPSSGTSHFELIGSTEIMGGIPTGGTVGQVLSKKSNIDGDVEWRDINPPIGWGIAKTGITSTTFLNNSWSSNTTVDISDLGLTSSSDYMVFTEPTTGGTTSRWGDAIAFTNNFTATSFTVGAYSPDTMDGEMKVKYIIFAKGFGTGGESIRATDAEVEAVVNKYF